MVTNYKLQRKFEMVDGNVVRREKPISALPRADYKLECGRETFLVKVSPGQAINTKKLCKKLKAKFNENGNKKFISKGFQS